MRYVKITTVVIIIGMFITSAFGIVPTGNGVSGSYQKRYHADKQTRLRNSQEWKRFKQKYGNGWTVRWNENTELPHRVWGEGIDVPTPDHSSQAVRICRNFMEQNEYWFSGEHLSLEKLSAVKKLDIWYVIFRESYKGVMVWNGRADFRIKNGSLLLFGADLHPQISLSTQPSVDKSEALQIASQDFNFDTTTNSKLVILPNAGQYYLTWWFKTENSDPVARQNIFVDAKTGEIRYHFNNLPTSVPGKITGEILPEYPSDPFDSVQIPHSIVKAEGEIADTANKNGEFNLPFEPSPSGTYSWSYLKGEFADVEKIGERGSWSGIAFDAESLLVHWDTSRAHITEINVYYHTNVVHSFFKNLDPDFSGMDYTVPVMVNDTVDPTPDNAFWNGEGMHFGRGNRCSNFGKFSDVIYHEYTHGVTQYIYPPGTLPYEGESGAINEALSDYFACTMLNDPEHGEGVCGSTPFRDLENSMSMPEDWEGEVHADGAIISGAWWDIRSELSTVYTDTLVHYSRYGAPEIFDDYMTEMLLVDDDDGNLDNGSPNFWTIVNAYHAHGIGKQEIKMVHTPRYDTEDTLHPYQISLRLKSRLPMENEEVKLYYAAEGTTFNTVIMDSTSDDERYVGHIPPHPRGTEIEYYLKAADTIRDTAYLPKGAPDSTFSFRVLEDTLSPRITHYPLTDQGKFAHPFTVTAKGYDNLGAPSIKLIASKNSLSPDTFVAEPVTEYLYKTKLNFDYVDVGDTIHYKVMAIDNASSANKTFYPDEGTIDFQIARSYFYNFDSDDGGFSGGGDWEWGSPSSVGPDTAFSTPKLWGTTLDNNYSNRSHSELISPPIALGDYSAATLEFQQYYDIQNLYDGGNIFISTDGGYRWHYVQPIEGYQGYEVELLGTEGFTGEADFWHKKEIDLSSFIGDTIKIKFNFLSDSYNRKSGWYIDNFAVIEKQILMPPFSLSGEGGWDGYVPLKWNAPATVGSDPSEFPETFIGYNIYRSGLSEEFIHPPINSTPVTDTFYVDSTVTNGEEYKYQVTTVYTQGESTPSNNIEVMPYDADINLSSDSIYKNVVMGRSVTESLEIRNEGTGKLEFEVYEYTSEPETLHASRGSHITPPGSWRLLREDPEEPDVSMNLKELLAQSDDGEFYSLATSYGPMGDPHSDFVVGFIFDTDLNPETGDDRFPGLGAEYMVAIGAIPFGDSDAILLKYNPDSRMGWDLIGEPSWRKMTSDGDSLGVGFNLSQIGSPTSFHIATAVITNLMTTPEIKDMIPNEGEEPIFYNTEETDWLTIEPMRGTAKPGVPSTITLDFNSLGLAPGDYKAWIDIDNSDRDKPHYVIPIVMNVSVEDIQEEKRSTSKFFVSEPLPNPFSSRTELEYHLPKSSSVSFTVMNLRGKVITHRKKENVNQGWHKVSWNGKSSDNSSLPNGLYLFKLETESNTAVEKVIHLK